MHPMDGAYLKLRRAKQHLEIINQVSDGLKKAGIYRIVQGQIGQGQAREHQVWFNQIKDFPPDLSLLLGDFCSNLRAALDHLVWQMWVAQLPGFAESVYFPICDSPTAFRGKAPSNIGPKLVKRATFSLSPDQRALIESLQPYNTGKNALSILRDVNNSDKHRLVQVIGVIPNTISVSLEIDQSRALIQVPKPSIIPVTVHGGTQVKDRTILARFPISGFSNGTEVKVNTAVVLDYAFEGSNKADGQLIRPSLIAMFDEVGRIVTKFEPEFSRFGLSAFK